MAKCPDCGAGIESDDFFCGACGRKIEDDAERSKRKGAEDLPPTCRDCGAALSAGDRFCCECGTPVELVAKPSEPVVAEKTGHYRTRAALGSGGPFGAPKTSPGAVVKVLVIRFLIVVLSLIGGLLLAFVAHEAAYEIGIRGDTGLLVLVVIVAATMAGMLAFLAGRFAVRLPPEWRTGHGGATYFLAGFLGEVAWVVPSIIFEFEPNDPAFGVVFAAVVLVTIVLMQILDRIRAVKGRK